mmetsp:Transcript_24066/g.41225  ORF Transcript_24066/g.41225 Transcript_24066/m.41225 type:complete len:155 (+) Transcript_24066:225-689(+)
MPMRLNAASFAFAMAILFSPATLGLSIVEDADAHQDHYDANVALIDVTHYPATASVNATPSAAPSLVAHSMVHSNKISYSCVELPVATDQEVIFLRPPSRAEVEASVEVDAASPHRHHRRVDTERRRGFLDNGRRRGGDGHDRRERRPQMLQTI